MHDLRVAHRYAKKASSCNFVSPNFSDCAQANIMMDGSLLFPGGWHPQHTQLSPDATTAVFGLSRTAVGGVKYYFIDFGISSFEEDSVLGLDGQERAPELSLETPYNPFQLDVWILGTVYKEFLLDVRSHLVQVF